MTIVLFSLSVVALLVSIATWERNDFVTVMSFLFFLMFFAFAMALLPYS